MSTVPTRPAMPTPVYSDPTGRRVVFVRRLSWALCAVFAVVVAAVGVALVAQVPLPGLRGLVPGLNHDVAPSPRVASRDQHRSQPDTAAFADPQQPVDGGVGRTQQQVVSRTSEELQGTPGAARSLAAVPRRETTGSPAITHGGPTPAGAAPTAPPASAAPAVATPTPPPGPAANAHSPQPSPQSNAHAATGHHGDSVTGAASAPGRNR